MKNKLFTLLVLHLGPAAVVAQPVITNQPQSQTAIAGTEVTISVGATGAPPLSYQWRSHANPGSYTNIPFGMEATLVLTNVQPTQRRFAVVVTDAGGLSVTSSPLVTLTVLFPPNIIQQPVSQSSEVGEAVALRVTATGTTPLSYQWLFNGQTLAGQTRTNLAWTSVQLSNAGPYSVVIRDSVASITSQVATLTVVFPIFTKITNGSIVNDGGFSFSCSWGDYDNDGFVDLFVCNWPENSGAQQDFLYHNNGNQTFTRIPNGPPVSAGRWAAGAAWGDYDNDGNLDLFVCRPGMASLGANTLYHNEGNGMFTSITTGLIVNEPMVSHAGIWADFDNNGFVDLCVVNFGGPTIPAPPNYLYRNADGLNFERVPFGSKSSTNGDSWNVAAADFNNDGWIDLFVPQGGALITPQNNLVYTNRRDGTFELLTNSIPFTHSANSVACAWGDYDNDGFLDLFVSNFFNQNNFLCHNNGDGTFALVTNSVVTIDGGTSVGCAWGDYDNDGWLDLFVANLGRYDSNTASLNFPSENNFLYHNNGDGTFTKVTGGRLVNDLGYSTGCAWADYDNDGFLDLFVANGWAGARSENNFLYHNNGNTNNWINFRLVGTVSNRSAIGAKVRVTTTIGGNPIWQMREISGGSNYSSQNDMRANFGLSDATNIDLVRIEWPSGTVQEFQNVAPRQFLTITEPPRLTATQADGQPQFTLKGGRGLEYGIEASTNLSSWLPLATVTITNLSGLAPIMDPDASGAKQKFFRAVAQ